MINRNLYDYLLDWKNSPNRLPLILRGARQVGKSTLVRHLGQSYDNYLEFNLEKPRDLEHFEQVSDLERTVQLLFLSRGVVHDESQETLIFIDEVQEQPEVIAALRYFYEDFPHLHVIATGSLLDFALDKVMKTPVGRVEYAELHPINFSEYVAANNKAAAELMSRVPINNALLGPLYELFHEYALVGGMPQLTAAYLDSGKDITKVKKLYGGLLAAYKSDVEKYAKNETLRKVIRHIMDTAPSQIDERVNLNNFGGSSFRNREVKEAMQALENARLLDLLYPTTHTAPPIVQDYRKRPRLQFLDIGLVNFQLGLHQELLTLSDLHDSTRGRIVQQLVYQEIKAQTQTPSTQLSFWVRNEGGTSSEVDLVYPYGNLLIPIEVKAGAKGRLRSLHEYMDRCTHSYAVRIYGGQLSIDDMQSRKGKLYKLMNLPYFLAYQIEPYLKWFMQQVAR